MINIQDFLKQKGYKDVPDILPESTKLPSQIDIQSFLREKGYEKFGVPTPTITPKTGPVDVESFLKEKKLGEPQPLALVEGKPKEEERVGLFESIKNFITSKPIRAVRNNNPGNLKSGSMLHDALASKNPDGSIKTDDQGHLVFPNKQVGWLASYADLDAKMAGLTRNELLADKAGVDVSIADLNQAYATDTNWKYSVAKIYNKLTGEKITTNTDVSTLDRDALQLAVLTQEGFILPKIDYALYSRLKERGVTDIEHFPMAKPQEQREFYEGKIPEPSGLKPTEVRIERPEPITDPTKIGGFLQFLGRSPKEQLKMLTQTPEIKIDKALEKQLKDKGIKNPLDFIEYSPENKRRILADEIEPKTLSKITVDDIEGIDTIKIFAENRVKELAEMSFKFPERRADYIKMASQWRQVLKMDDLKDKNGFQDFITGIISDFKEDKTEKMVLFMRSLLPYLRLESDKIKQISKKIEKNESLTTAEQNYIDKYMLEQTAETKRASHFWFNIGKNIIEMPAWIGEMAAMLYATRGVRTNIGTAMQGMTGKRLLSIIIKIIKKLFEFA